MSRSEPPLIRASDVGRYAYCARAWWLAVVREVPIDPARFVAGTAAHTAHGRRVRSSVWQLRVGLALVGLAVLLGVWVAARG